MNNKKLLKDQSGIASTVIVILMMTLITLIVIGMSQNANREQREALDRELNTQAQYAAEAGIADAAEYIEKNKNAGIPIDEEVTECGKFPAPDGGNLTSDGNIKYTCLLYDRSPNTLEYSSVSDRSELIPINLSSGNSITITWQEKGGTGIKNIGSCPSSVKTQPQLLDINNYKCSVGVLRVDIIDPTLGLSRQSLIDTTYTSFLIPNNGGGGSINFSNPVSGSQNRKGVVTPAKCTDTPTTPAKKCSVTISGLNTGGGETVYLRLKSIYKESEVTIFGGSSFDPASAPSFRDAQAIIDSTGRASDVLKRVQVRSPLPNKQYFPEFAVYSSDDLCKLLQISRQGNTGPLVTESLEPTECPSS